MTNIIHMTMTIWIIKWGDDDFADNYLFIQTFQRRQKNVKKNKKRKSNAEKPRKLKLVWDKRDHSAGTKRVLALNWSFLAP